MTQTIILFLQDVYRIGTLLELMRELAFTFVNDGKRVRVSQVMPMATIHYHCSAVLIHFTFSFPTNQLI